VNARPSDAERRRAALEPFGADPFAATAFSDLTRMAADLLEAPMAAISVIDVAGGRLHAEVGIAGGKRSSDALATWALCQPTEVLVVEDSTKDPEMQKALSESGLADVRFYAAVPLTLSSGEAIGALCVMGRKPRKLFEDRLEKLRFLADQVIQTLEVRQRDSRS
jgi:GAF domain-containing protein